MRLNNLEFIETLKPNNQVCGGDNNSDVDVDVDGMIDVEFDITELDFNDAGVYIADGWDGDVTVTVTGGQIVTGVEAYGSITIAGWDGGEISGSLFAAIN